MIYAGKYIPRSKVTAKNQEYHEIGKYKELVLRNKCDLYLEL